MSFLRPSVSFTRFKLREPAPAALWQAIPDKLRQFAFRDIDNIPEERGWGWVNFDDILDTEWTTSGPEKGAYLTFSLRLDTRRISPAVLRIHTLKAMREEERKNKEDGKNFVSRLRKKEIKESVKARLMHRALPVPAESPAVLMPLLQARAFYGGIAALAAARGLDPDRPPHLRKVTQTL